MAKQSPLQIVKDKYGSKKELAAKLSSILEPAEGESKEEHEARLSLVSNAKLIHLQALAEKVEEHGGREGLVKKIVEAEGKSKDEDYVKALTTKRTLGWLVDRAQTHARRAKSVKSA